MKVRGILILGLALALLAAACGSDAGNSTPSPVDQPSDSTDAVSNEDRPCNGGAFPDDDEFHQLICDVQYAQLDVLAADGAVDATWGSRLTAAMQTYPADRTAAVADIQALIGDINAAVP